MIEINPKDFTRNLKRLRIAHGYTQESLAEKIDTTHSTINRWESGKHNPGYIEFFRLMQVFGIGFEELAGVEPLSNDSLTKEKPTLREALQVVRDEMGLSIEISPGFEIIKKS